MRTLLLCLVLCLSHGCQDACEAQCASLDTFFEACADALEEAGVLLVCYDDEVEAFEDGSIDPTHARTCTDGPDYRRSCMRVSHARANALPTGENLDRLDACESMSDWAKAVERKDCAAAAAAWADGEHARR